MKSFKCKAAVVVAASLVATALPVTGVENVKAEAAIEESVKGAEDDVSKVASESETAETDTATKTETVQADTAPEVDSTSETAPTDDGNAQEQQHVDYLIINQVYGTADKTDTPITNSFIELYNPTDGEVSLEGYCLVYETTENNAFTLNFGAGDKIGAGSSYLIVCNKVTTNDTYITYDLPKADKTQADLVIDNKNYTITLKTENQEVDQVTANEKVDAIKVSKQKSLRRKNYQDTDTNADWQIIGWEKKSVTVNQEYVLAYAPRNSKGEYGSVHTSTAPDSGNAGESGTVAEPTYTPVTAGAIKVKGFNNEKSSLDMELFARYNSGAMSEDGGSLEIVEYNSKNGYAYAVSGLKGKIIAVKIAGAANGDTVTKLDGTEYDVKTMVSSNTDFAYGDITSVAISPDGTRLAAAVQHADYATAGAVAIFTCGADGSLTDAKFVQTGVQPDMVTFVDNNTILTADEGEPRNGYNGEIAKVDPKGSVSIINVPALSSVQVGFENYTADELIAKNIILGVTGSAIIAPQYDLEPEYIAVSSDGKTADVSLQEANAISVLDIEKKEFTGIYSVGFEDYSKVAVDLVEDGTYEAKTYDNLVGARMPDGIALYENDGKTYLVTANEGDAREWGDYKNEAKTKDFTKENIRILNSDFCEGLPESKSVMFGGRGFSVFEVTNEGLKEAYDSGNEFESITAQVLGDYFNCSNDDVEADSRSPKKGPEPENVTVGTVNGKTYAFIAIERIGGIMVYDITDPANAQYVNYINSREFDDAIQGDVSPEGLCFVDNGTNGNPILLAACEVSGTLAAYELKAVGSSTENPSEDSGGSTSGSTSSGSSGSASSGSSGSTSGGTTGGSSTTQDPIKKPEQTTDDKKEDTKKPEQTTDKKTEAAKPVKTGTVVKDTKTKAKYEVVSTAKGQPKVQYQGTTDKTKKTVSIPSTVKVDGVTYKVTEIGKNTFKNNKTVTKVSVGKNITSIGANAFNGCTKLKTITINTKLLTAKNVSKYAFKGISSDTVIKVPKSKLAAYTKLFQKKGLSKKVKIQGV